MVGKNSCLISMRCVAPLTTNATIFGVKTILWELFKRFFAMILNLLTFHLPFQTKVTNDLNLINKSKNIVVDIICIVLDMHSSWMEIEHCTQTFFYDMQNSKFVSKNSELNFTHSMKCCHFNMNVIKHITYSRSEVDMFYKKRCCMGKKLTISEITNIGWKIKKMC
jgi:hypothetical protein